jgi:methenyltetrahydromethanopterin cyclohydrolase
MPPLNARAWQLCDDLASQAENLNIAVSWTEANTRLIDCGVDVVGGLGAGRRLAEICLAGLGRVDLVPGLDGGLCVFVQTDQPIAACMASQYAGWQITGEKYFAMGSGPMRAAAAREPLFLHIGYTERPQRVVGVVEASKLPPAAVCHRIAEQCQVAPSDLTLAIARTSSLAGCLQVVARSVETALHKLHELGYDLKNIVSAFGTAPLPPVAATDISAIGRTNDAVLYGGQVTLWVHDTDERLQEIGPKVPSSASRDFGEPFAAIFERYSRDFYKIDPHLFSPARITFINLSTGQTHRFGNPRPDILSRSFSS